MSEKKKVKQPRKITNKARDFVFDYYITNREIGKANHKQNEENPQNGWTPSAKIYLGIIIVGLIGIVIRYVIL